MQLPRNRAAIAILNSIQSDERVREWASLTGGGGGGGGGLADSGDFIEMMDDT